MSSVDSLLSRLREVYAEVASVEAVAKQHPGDVFVMASLTSLKRQAEEYEQEWYELAYEKQIEVCRYRLSSTRGFRYPASFFARSVENFQNLFSQIFDAIENGPKQRSRLSAGIVSETQFDFAYTYPGSLGVVLMIQGERDLLSSKFDSSIASVSQLMEIEDEDDVRDISAKLGEAVLKRVYDWSTQNLEFGFEVDIDWRSAQGVLRGGHLGIDRMKKISEIIGRTSDTTSKLISATGVLLAIDVDSGRFRFVEPSGEVFSGYVDDSFDLTNKWSVNTYYNATIHSETTLHYATERKEVNYRLLTLRNE